MHVLRNPLFAHSNANALKVKNVGAFLARHGYKVKKGGALQFIGFWKKSGASQAMSILVDSFPGMGIFVKRGSASPDTGILVKRGGALPGTVIL